MFSTSFPSAAPVYSAYPSAGVQCCYLQTSQPHILQACLRLYVRLRYERFPIQLLFRGHILRNHLSEQSHLLNFRLHQDRTIRMYCHLRHKDSFLSPCATFQRSVLITLYVIGVVIFFGARISNSPMRTQPAVCSLFTRRIPLILSVTLMFTV